jgi:hypothetical protein
MMLEKRKLLVLSFSNLKRDPRVYRQLVCIKSLERCNIFAAGFEDPEFEEIKFLKLSSKKRRFDKLLSIFQLKTKRFERYYWSSCLVKDAFNKLGEFSFDLILANDLETLPLALALAARSESKIFLDVHEYEPKHFEESWTFRFFFQAYWDYIARKYLPKVDVMTTVCRGISLEYERNYGVKSTVITNAPLYSDLNAQDVDESSIKIIHHGNASRYRRLENMIYLMDYLDERFTLDLMLVPSQTKTYQQLKKLVVDRQRIRLRDPVPMLSLPETINQYDIGLCLFPPVSFNLKMALPNKFFEFIQGRVAIATWPSVEIKILVEKYSCGVVAQEFTIESMAASINQLMPAQIKSYKENSSKAAVDLCAERNFEVMNNIVNGLLPL